MKILALDSATDIASCAIMENEYSACTNFKLKQEIENEGDSP